MNPSFLDEPDAPAAPRPSLRERLANLLAWTGRLLCFDLFNPREVHPQQGTVIGYIARAVTYRLLFVPVLLCAAVVAMVHQGTHPPQITQTSDPASLGVFFQPLAYQGADDRPREGWLVPLLDARTVLDKQDQALAGKAPAVVLIHDIAAGRQQMLPLIEPLHKAGFAVVVIGLGNPADPGVGVTFGLREASDISSCVETLRRHSGIDPGRIALLGVGAGANAALLAARNDPRLAALVLDHPIVDSNQMVHANLSPPQPWLRWLTPMCHWAFEITYRVNAEDLDLHRYADQTKSDRTLMLSGDTSTSCFRPAGARRVSRFLSDRLTLPDSSTATLDNNR